MPRGTSSSRRAAIYTRLSQERQGEAKEGRNRQYNACRKLCREKGWSVVGHYSDADVSAFKRVPRPEFERMRSDIAAAKVDVVVCWKLDRITRGGIREIAPFLDELEAYDVTLASVTEQIDTSTPMGEAMLGVLASMAKQESENISIRVRAAAAARAARGKVNGGGSRTFGYTRDMQLIEPEAEALNLAASMVLDGQSLRSVCRSFNEADLPTTTGGRWSATPLKYMLTNPVLAGYRIYEGTRYPGSWAPVFDEDTHNALIARLNDPTRRSSTRGGDAGYLLTGIIYCGNCGGRMRSNVVRNRNDTSFLRWQCAKDTGNRNCGSVSASMRSVDAVVLLDAASEFWRRHDPNRTDEGVADLLQQIRDDEEALVDLARARYVDRTLGEAEHLTVSKELNDRIDHLKLDLENRRYQIDDVGYPQPFEFIEEFQGWVTTGSDFEYRRTLVRRLIKRVEVRPAKHRGGNVFDTTRVRIVWRDSPT